MPPRRPYALVPPTNAAPTARPVHSMPLVGATGPSDEAAISTPAPAASGIEIAIAPAVRPAATGPRRRAGSATGRNRPTERRTDLTVPSRPPRTATTATPTNR